MWEGELWVSLFYHLLAQCLDFMATILLFWFILTALTTFNPAAASKQQKKICYSNIIRRVWHQIAELAPVSD